ncbi:MAG TPA: flagellar hook capping FlgD N-terminal domain-containing protein [Bacillota bacterium]|nr:flagellar hook capping FlgD N-terminal domain-containing protein [Bacillota bacterium]
MSTTTVSTSNWWKTPSTTDSSSSSSSSASNSVDYESFLTLLTTELQNQDPTDPVSNTEYVSQLAQVASLQQLNTLSSSMDSSRAYGMLGKEVTYTVTNDSGTSTTATGSVQSVISKNNTTYLIVDGAQVALSAVTQVSNGTTSTANA